MRPSVVIISGAARHGKDTYAAAMRETLPFARPVAFADRLKEIFHELSGVDVTTCDEIKEGCRPSLILLGQAMREFDQDYWARCACAEARKCDVLVGEVVQPVIFTDCRYPGEVKYVRREFGAENVTHVHVVRYTEDGRRRLPVTSGDEPENCPILETMADLVVHNRELGRFRLDGRLMGSVIRNAWEDQLSAVSLKSARYAVHDDGHKHPSAKGGDQ